MSVDIRWETLTGGPDGAARAEAIRSFIHAKFQEITLPRFIRSIKVHSFDFGSIAPELELKDICDPLPDFYEEDEDDSSSEGTGEDDDHPSSSGAKASNPPLTGSSRPPDRVVADDHHHHQKEVRPPRRPPRYDERHLSTQSLPTIAIDTRLSRLRPGLGAGDHLGISPLARASTPGIPGGTSNMSYFHLPLGAGLSGAATPLAAAVAGAQFQASWPDHLHHLRYERDQTATLRNPPSLDFTPPSTADPGSRPPSQHQHDPTLPESLDAEEFEAQREHPRSPNPLLHSHHHHTRVREQSPEDLQIVCHVHYSGDIKMSLTAEILLDYPMPSFVGIPIKLNITGLTFDGVAILAYIKHKAHFCFLSPEDADALVGGEASDGTSSADARGPEGGAGGQPGRRPAVGRLLEHIKVESEIGQKENGKQVLKNIGQVEKFILEQVRRIFEDEFVYPSFWTFLV